MSISRRTSKARAYIYCDCELGYICVDCRMFNQEFYKLDSYEAAVKHKRLHERFEEAGQRELMRIINIANNLNQ